MVVARLAHLRQRIRTAGGDPGRVRVVAVTKGFGPAAVEAARAGGLLDVGENYAQELLAKASACGAAPPGAWPPDATPPGAGPTGAAGEPPLVRWHHVGAVQRRQVPRLAPLVTLWHGVCRVEEGRAIAAVVPQAPVLVQLEVAGRPDRRGVAPGDAAALVAGLREAGVRPVGVMALGVAGDPEATAAAFARAVTAAVELDLPERSLGMSDDLELAVAAGATMVRVGRALFGQRPAAGPPPHPSAALT